MGPGPLGQRRNTLAHQLVKHGQNVVRALSKSVVGKCRKNIFGGHLPTTVISL